MPEAVRYRDAHLADAAAIGRLHAASWRENYRGILLDAFLDGEVEADRAALWHGRLAAPVPDQFVEVADVDGSVGGFVCAFAGADSRCGSLIDNAHVARAYLGQGIGTALLSHAFAWLRRRDAHGGVSLWVFDRNEAARRLYHRLGGVHAETVDKPTPGGGTSRCCRYVWDSAAADRVAEGRP